MFRWKCSYCFTALSSQGWQRLGWEGSRTRFRLTAFNCLPCFHLCEGDIEPRAGNTSCSSPPRRIYAQSLSCCSHRDIILVKPVRAMVEPEGIHSYACSYSHAFFWELLLSDPLHPSATNWLLKAPSARKLEGKGYLQKIVAFANSSQFLLQRITVPFPFFTFCISSLKSEISSCNAVKLHLQYQNFPL